MPSQSLAINNPVSFDIVEFNFNPVYDLSGAVPKLKLLNASLGPALANCQVIFTAKTANGIIFHQGDWGAPDANGGFTEYVVPEPITQIQNHIEWSGPEFSVVGYVRDSSGTIYGPLEKRTVLCMPAGNAGKPNNFGGGKVDLQVLCHEARIFYQDLTDYSYRGLPGTTVSKKAKLFYPPDTTDVTPPPYDVDGRNADTIPIWYSSENYQFLLETVMSYTFDNGSTVIIKYKHKRTFPVLCNVDLCKLACDVTRIAEAMMTEGCNAEQREKLMLANFYLSKAMIAKLQPTCGVNLHDLVAKIKELVGSDCDCVCVEGIHQLAAVQNVGSSAVCNVPKGVTCNIQ